MWSFAKETREEKGEQSLLKNLLCEEQPSMVLHLVVVILFQQSTNCAVHVSGKLLPQVIHFLRSHLDEKKYAALTEFEKSLIKYLSMEKERNSSAINDVVVHETPREKSAECSELIVLKKQIEHMLDDVKQLVKQRSVVE